MYLQNIYVSFLFVEWLYLYLKFTDKQMYTRIVDICIQITNIQGSQMYRDCHSATQIILRPHTMYRPVYYNNII